MTSGPVQSAVSRRAVLTGAVAGAGLAAAGGAAAATAAGSAPPADFYGPHQAGIVTPMLAHLSLAGFDVVTRNRAGLVRLLQEWSRIAADLMADPGPAGRPGGPAAGLTITFGLGPSLFDPDRFGIADRRPAALRPLPAFAGEALNRAASNGDLCVQACASTPTVAHHAVRTLLNATRSLAALRWRQTGFTVDDGTVDPRGLFGFRDGTNNLAVHDPRETAAHLWVDDGPQWMHGGSYLVMRRIRLLLDTWDRTALAEQEAVVGRRCDTNERLADAPPTAHVRLAAASANGGAKLLRRSYSYDAGVDPNGLLDAGLVFLCYQRDPHRQFVPVQRRLAGHDPLNGFSQHLASGVYACPPGIRAGSFLGAELLA